MDTLPKLLAGGATLSIVVLAALVALAAVPTGAQAQSESAYAVRQIEDGTVTGCATIQPLGDGTASLDEMYGYASPPELSGLNSQSVQYSDVSLLFLYQSSDGLALVMIHDQYGDGTPGGTANMTVSGLPSTAEVGVADDPDDASESADSFELSEESDSDEETLTGQFDWEWGESETDGVAISGLSEDDFGPISIEPGFDSNTGVRAWGLLGANSEQPLSLNKDRRTTIEQGTCPGYNGAATSTAGSTATGDDGVTSRSQTTSAVPSTSTGTESSPAETTTATQSATPDPSNDTNTTLEVTSIEMDDSTPAVDQPVNITATVQNTGDQQFAGTIVFQTSENSTETREISLSPGSTQTLRFQHTYEEQGTYTIRAGQASTEVVVSESTSTSGPGFGITGALIAAVMGSILAVRVASSHSLRRNSSNQESESDEEGGSTGDTDD